RSWGAGAAPAPATRLRTSQRDGSLVPHRAVAVRLLVRSATPQHWPAGPHNLRVLRARCTGDGLPGGSRDEDDGAATPGESPVLPGSHRRLPGSVAATCR